MNKIYKIRLKKGDTVMVLSGKYKGKTGKVTAVHPKLNKATVDAVNVVKRHVKPTTQFPQGGIIDETKPIWVSKLAVVDPVSKKPTKISYQVSKDGKKTRAYKASGKEMK